VVLSDVDIKKALENGTFIINPSPSDDDFDTTAVNLHLGQEFLTWDFKAVEAAFGPKGITVDLSSYDFSELAGKFAKELTRDADGSVVLNPHQYILCKTNEIIGNPDPACCLAARVEGRSSLARLGLQIHMTAPTVHAGFHGHLALEIFNAGPFRLRLSPGVAICQLIVEKVSSTPGVSMNGTRFQGQESARGRGTGNNHSC
jgi:dCTP deaminase